MLVAVLLTAGLGYWLDRRFWGGHGWGLMAGLLLGLAAGTRNLLRSAKRVQADLEREDEHLGAKRWKVDENWLNKPPED
jgi:F0F1-type ATP synthase assembly protein I